MAQFRVQCGSVGSELACCKAGLSSNECMMYECIYCIFSKSHQTLDEVPPENILKIYSGCIFLRSL